MPLQTALQTVPAAQGGRPVLLGQDHIRRALSDDRFFSMMPEFAQLRKKMEAAHADLHSGCAPCRRRRVAQSMSADFASVLNGLSPDGISRFKKYLGVGRLLMRAMDRSTGRVVLKEV